MVTSQYGNQFIPTNMFSYAHNVAIPDISYNDLNIGEATESMNNGNSSCLIMHGDYLQGSLGNVLKQSLGSLCGW